MMVLDLIIPIALAVAALLLTLSIFTFREIMHSGISLASLFLAISAIYLALGQPFLAAIQAFIMVGGVATYLMIGSAVGGVSRFPHSRPLFVAILAALVFAILFYPLVASPQGYLTGDLSPPSISSGGIISSFDNGIPLFYLLLFFLSGISFGSIILFRKVMR